MARNESASSGSLRSISSRANPATAPTWSGCTSSALRNDCSSPSATSRSASLGAGASRWTNSVTWASGSAPTNPSTTCPSLRAYTAGIDWTWNIEAILGFSSTLTLTRSTCPSVAATTRSRIGPSVRQGPHHGAQRSTTTGTSRDRVSTSCSKFASVTSVIGLDPTRWRPRRRLDRDASPRAGSVARRCRMHPP